MAEKRTSRKSSAEKVVFWVGSLCGILLSLMTLYEKIVAPGPARLSITFRESSTTTLNLVAPNVDATGLSEPVPLALEVRNRGGKASANTKLYLAHNPSLQLIAQYQKEEKETWNAPNELVKQLILSIENLNPGESFLIPVTVRFVVGPDAQTTLRPAPLGFTVLADLSSDTVPSARTDLLILLGQCRVLRERGDVYWIGHGPDGVHVLKVKEDYPCQ